MVEIARSSSNTGSRRNLRLDVRNILFDEALDGIQVLTDAVHLYLASGIISEQDPSRIALHETALLLSKKVMLRIGEGGRENYEPSFLWSAREAAHTTVCLDEQTREV